MPGRVIETELAKMSAEQKAVINVAGIGDVTGTVRLVTPEVDETTRLGRVRIFLGDDPKLRIGSFARGTVDTAHAHGLLSLPSSRSCSTPRVRSYRVVRDGHVARRNIETGLICDGRVEGARVLLPATAPWSPPAPSSRMATPCAPSRRTPRSARPASVMIEKFAIIRGHGIARISDRIESHHQSYDSSVPYDSEVRSGP